MKPDRGKKSHALASLGLTLGLACSMVGDLGSQLSDAADGTAGDSGASGSGATDESGTDGDGSGDSGFDDTGLPSLPPLENLRVRINGDAANVSFDMFAGAVDYRIYPLPAGEDIAISPDGAITIADATYRCAGRRESLYMLEDLLNPTPGWNDNGAGGSTLLDGEVEGVPREPADALLGHVYTIAGPDRTPVFALGSSDPAADGGVACGRPIFNSTRLKRYTTSPGERDALLAARWRDHGVAFYVPTSRQAETRPVYEGLGDDTATLRWIDGPEGEVRGTGEVLFRVLTEPDADSSELRRLHVLPYCASPHDELVAGEPRFTKTRSEGDHPLNAVRWSGLTEETVLVVEALASGCPNQGNLSPGHEAAYSDGEIDYEGYSTVPDMRAGSPTGEVFVNGQYDTDARPSPIARSYVTVAPELPTNLEFYATFPESEDFRAAFAEPTGSVYGQHFVANDFTFSSYSASHVHFGSFLGEFWAAYNDIDAGVNARVRLTPHQMALISEDFLHVTTEFNVVTTRRRYPQILISDQAAPIEEDLAIGTTIIIEPIGYAPAYLQVEICQDRAWGVDEPCPQLLLFSPDNAPTAPLLSENAGEDNAVTLDVYLSSDRLYLLVDDQPFACTDFPATASDDSTVSPPQGAVSVTWGDVLAHSAIDFATGDGAIDGNSYVFHRAHMHHTTRRHFDNIGFASGAAPPLWDESRVPCITQ